MCGIGGFSGQFPAALLDRMNLAQAHRGPDGEGVYHDPARGVGLAHRRLAILDLTDAGLQPMWSGDGRLAILFNGEIYNFLELRAELAARGHAFRTGSDTEVLLAMYREHGPAMLDRLNGMFAFALWDADAGHLLLARDRYGVKPLYYARTSRGLLFASELRTLLLDPEVPREIDPDALALLLTYIWAPAPHTPIRAIRKLEPGCAMLVRNGAIEREWRYAELPATPDQTSQPVGPVAEQLRSLLDQAVGRQLVSDVPVGAFLSGGLDSSAVVAFATRRLGGGALQCFTLGEAETDRGFVADLPYARQVADHLGVPLTEAEVDDAWMNGIPAFLAAQDTPVADPAALNVFQICSAARARGIKVLLSGAGGDDLFSGYRRHLALRWERAWSWAPRPVRRLLSAGAALLPRGNATTRRARKALEYAHLPTDERLVRYFFWADPALVSELTGSTADVAAPLRDALAALPPGTPPLERMLYLEKRFFLVDHNLAYTDKAAMAASVEVRVPFLDPNLVDFAARLHPALKVRGREAKWIFKRAMEGILPRNVIWRPKTGFGGPLATWLRGPLRPWLRDELDAACRRGLVAPGPVASTLRALDAGADDAAYTLFVIASVSAWLGGLPPAMEAHADLATAPAPT